MRLYLRDRVEAVERLPEFVACGEEARRRSQASRRANDAKPRRLQGFADAIEVTVRLYGEAELIRLACDHYNRLQSEREADGRTRSDLFASPDSEPAFLDRICVNYLRHVCTRYEETLDEVAGKVGADEARSEVRERSTTRSRRTIRSSAPNAIASWTSDGAR